MTWETGIKYTSVRAHSICWWNFCRNSDVHIQMHLVMLWPRASEMNSWELLCVCVCVSVCCQCVYKNTFPGLQFPGGKLVVWENICYLFPARDQSLPTSDTGLSRHLCVYVCVRACVCITDSLSVHVRKSAKQRKKVSRNKATREKETERERESWREKLNVFCQSLGVFVHIESHRRRSHL